MTDVARLREGCLQIIIDAEKLYPGIIDEARKILRNETPCPVCSARFDERCLAEIGETCPQPWRDKGPLPIPIDPIPPLRDRQ